MPHAGTRSSQTWCFSIGRLRPDAQGSAVFGRASLIAGSGTVLSFMALSFYLQPADDQKPESRTVAVWSGPAVGY